MNFRISLLISLLVVLSANTSITTQPQDNSFKAHEAFIETAMVPAMACGDTETTERILFAFFVWQGTRIENPAMRDALYYTILDYAKESGNLNIIQLVKSYEIDAL